MIYDTNDLFDNGGQCISNSAVVGIPQAANHKTIPNHACNSLQNHEHLASLACCILVQTFVFA